MNFIIGRKSFTMTRMLYQIRKAGYWNKDWQPGPVPETSEQITAAAKKYKLTREEYECYQDGSGYEEPGDYPKLPVISVENKDIHYPWDLPDERRNFGEPMHKNAIFLGETRFDSHGHLKYKYSELQMFLGLVIGCFICYLPSYDPIDFFPPVAKRQYPKQGVINYTYESAE